MEQRIDELELQYQVLQEKVVIIDEYARHIMNHTMTILATVIAIASVVIIGAAYYFIRNAINKRVDTEIERRVVNALRDNPSVYYARGKDKPDQDKKIYLSKDINGIEDLEPETLMMINGTAKGVSPYWNTMAEGLNPELRINEDGIREIEFKNYNGEEEVAWTASWARKNYK